MDTHQQSLETLKDIKTMMERSSRFISLSGLSGVAAGICGLIGAGFAYRIITRSGLEGEILNNQGSPANPLSISNNLGNQLLQVALFTLIAAVILAFLFTWLRSRKNGTPLWGTVSRKLAISILIPMTIGGIFLLKLVDEGSYALVAPGCLIFYGLALLNASGYTLAEIKWLGYAELATGVIALFFTRYGLYFWAFGFGLLHIVYGILMWNRYERKEVSNN